MRLQEIVALERCKLVVQIICVKIAEAAETLQRKLFRKQPVQFTEHDFGPRLPERHRADAVHFIPEFPGHDGGLIREVPAQELELADEIGPAPPPR